MHSKDSSVFADNSGRLANLLDNRKQGFVAETGCVYFEEVAIKRSVRSPAT